MSKKNSVNKSKKEREYLEHIKKYPEQVGWQGHNGLLITPQFGQRQRIAPIFIKSKVFEFTDNRKHVWIEDFCNICRKCEKACPPQAIYSNKKTSTKNVSGLCQTRTCIDRTKCYPQFNKDGFFAIFS